MIKKRKQLTLFLEEKAARSIEAIRQQFNPVQYDLIKGHITLCREDEIENLAVISTNLMHLNSKSFELSLGPVKRFSDGKGVFIPIKDENHVFQRIRELILKPAIPVPRIHQPHITLMHPRNSTCTDELFEKIKQVELPETVRITTISLIEQELGKKWKTLKEYRLTD